MGNGGLWGILWAWIKQQHQEGALKLLDMPREMAWLLIASIIVNLASNMYLPFLPLYLETLGASIEQVGFFFTALTLMALLFRVLGGWISDTLDHPPHGVTRLPSAYPSGDFCPVPSTNGSPRPFQKLPLRSITTLCNRYLR